MCPPPHRNPGVPQCPIELCGWRGKASIRAFVPKNERFHYLRMVGMEVFLGKQGKGARSRDEAGESPAPPAEEARKVKAEEEAEAKVDEVSDGENGDSHDDGQSGDTEAAMQS